MDIINILMIGTSVIGTSTVILRIIAPLTKTKLDNKILRGLELITEIVAFDSKSKILNIDTGKDKLVIKLRKK